MRNLSPLSLLVLTACGGGNSTISTFLTSASGKVIKGPLNNALVGLDYDGDGVVDSATVRTDANGAYSISTSQKTYTVIAVTDESTVDTSSGTVLSGVTLKAPEGATVITPTTTLMKEGNLTAEQVASVLGLPDGVDPLTFNPFADGVSASDALAVEKASQQVMSVVNAFASAAEGAGATEAAAYTAALNSIVEVVKTKAASSETLDLTSTADLALIKTQAKTEMASTAGVNTTAFNALADDTATAVENVNTKIDSITDTDLTSDASKNIFSTTQVLADQVKTAAIAEVSSSGTGNITFTDASVVNTAASNKAPTNITLSKNAISEAASSLVIGTLTTADSDQTTGVKFKYALAEITGSDYAAFSINQSTGELSLKAQPDYETKSSYSVTILSTDEGGKTFSKSFTVSITDESEAPTLTVPTGGSVTEDATTSTITGSLVGSDPEDDSLTYSVVGSTPSSGSYSVTGTYGTLVLNASTGAYTYTLNNSATAVQALGASSSETETFSVKVSDGTNTPAAQNLVFTIKGANDAPTITVSGLTSIAENSTNAVAATVSSSDAEDGSKTVTLSGTGRDDAKFEIVDGKLRIKTSADYETQDTYQVQLKVTDDAGVAVLKNLEFGVTDVAEAISGSVVDGYVAGATIFQDLDNDNVLDSGEAYTTTSATGAFTLTGIVASKTAPLKMISGFDIGTNQPIVTSLGVPTNITGTAVASPIATIAATNQANNSDVSLTHVVDRVATYFNISETSQANINILNDDPITKLTDSSSDVVSAAKDVFEANQFIMGLTHISEKAGKYLADQIDAAIQNAGDNSYGTYAGGSVSAYEKLGADAFLDTAGSHVMTPITPTTANAFQISSAQIEWHDYDPTLALDVTNRVVSSTSGSTVSLGSEAVKLNVQNLINAANTSGTYKSPKLSFELLNVPNGSGSGTVNFILIDGTDGTRSSGERQVYLDVDVNWTGDGETATITMPTQTLSGYYLTASDLKVDFTLSNLDDDTISITQGRSYTDNDYPATLEIRLASVIDKLESVGSISLLKEGTFNLSVSTDLPLKDSNDVTVTKLQTNLQLVDDTPLEVFVEDATYFEDDASPTTTIYLNRVHTEDITITYNVAVTGSDNATAGSDFTGQTSKTVTILAGLTSVTVALPILADSSVESAETFSVVATSASAGSLKKATGTVTIDDSDTTVSTSGELDSLAADVVSDLATDIGAALLTAYQTAASSASKSLSATSSDISTAAAAVTPGLTTVMKAFYGIVAAEITSAVSSNSAAADFAQALMTANSATKLFDPSTIIGTYINGNGTYIGSNDLSSLTAAIQSEYNTFKTYAVETVGDVFGTDTAANFAGAVVNMLTTGNDKETLTSASEIIPTFDGTDTVYAAGGNDKIIGGSGVDTFYGQDGNDHLYGYRGNDVLDGGDGNDKIVGGLGDDTISGGAGNDYVLAQTGDDTISTGTGTDEVLGGLGDDVITVDGTGNKTIDGGTGTDSLTISVSGISGLGDYTPTANGDYTVLTDSNNNVIQFKNIENLTVGSYAYTNDTSDDTFWNSTEKALYMYDGGNTSSSSITSLSGFSASANLSVVGSGLADSMNLNIDRSSALTGNLTLSMGDGNDTLLSSKFKNSDSVDMGAGDDTIYVMVGGGSGTPDFGSFDMTKLDGGAGTDTLYFVESTTGGAELNLSIGGAVNFENLSGTQGSEIIRGNSGDNILYGNSGSDTIYGGAGNDIIAGNDQIVESDNATVNAKDNLYGEAGDDTLFGTDSDNILDGGAGSDKIYSGNGSDTIVLRAGDGGSTLAAADTINEFTDGSDVLGMDDDLQYSQLTIAQGSGSNSNDTIIKYGSEYLAILKNIDASDIDYFDFTSMATGNQTLSGTSGDDVLIGAAGVDTVTSNTGADVILTHGGDDVITVDGTGNKTIDGGTGTDSLTISVSGISGLGDYTPTANGDYTVLTDSNNNVIQFKNIENLTVGSYAYTNDTSDDTFWNSTEKALYMYDGGNTSSSSITSLSGFSASANLSVVGSGLADSMNLNIDRSSALTGNLTLSMGDGNDTLLSSKFKNSDSVDMGAGDDTIYVMVGGGSGTPDFGSFDMTKLDGGAGTDTLYFVESTTGGAELNLSIGGAVNFENLSGTQGSEIIRGNSGDNILYGNSGSDTIYGGAGNDIIAGNDQIVESDNATVNAKDNLYGEAGDDTLFGTDSDNILDGGAGSDKIYSGNGSDTIVLRAGDGGSTLAAADTINEFTDGSDVLGMDDDLQYSQLTIAQGSGSNSNDTIIKYGSEYLAILKNIDASDIDYFDFTSMATGNQTLSGTSGDDVLIGAAGVDTVTSNTGADVILTHGGDDVITVDGTGNKTIDGGTGTDSLTISVSGISGLGDYTPTANGDYTVLTDSNNNVIQFKNIENLTVGSYAYTNDTSDDTFWNSTEKALYMYDGGNTSSSSITSLSGFSASANLSVVGSGLADSMNLNIDRSSALTGNLTLSMGDGNDTLLSSKFKNSDSVDMGAGDDTIYVMVGGGSGTPDFGSFDMTKLDGGAGTDTLYFVESTTGGAELNLSIGGAVNFENLSGTQGSEIIRGNSGDNILYGNSGSDTIYGGAGNDIIAGNDQIVESDNATVNAKDNLYGEAGDDTLFGTDSDNILDGGAGSDKIYSGNGSDTIVLRAGDGGSTLAAADTINEFTDGSDVLGMDDDLQYSQLTIAQGSGSNSNDTIIKYGSEYLAILKNIDVDLLTEADFTPVDIA